MASPRRARLPRWWRDPQRLLFWYVAAGVLVFVGVTIGPALFGRGALLSLDRLTANYPWLANGSQATGHQLCSTDTIDSQIPATAFIKTQLFAGHLPNWQNLVAGGSPLGSQPNLGLLNPMSLPYFVLPLWLAPAFIKLLEFVVAIGGTYLFARRLAVRRAAGLLAGLVFACSGFMVMWTNWPQAEVAACIPALFWVTERLIQRARLTDAIPVALVTAAMLLGGFPAVTGWALYAAAGYLIVRLVALHRHDAAAIWRRIGIGAGGIVVGAMLSGVQLLPFVETYTATNFGYRSGFGFSPLPFSGLLTLIVPDATGLCIGGARVYGPLNPVELVSYIGGAAAVLVVVGAAATMSRSAAGERRVSLRSVRGYFVLATALVLFIGWGTTVVLQIVDHLPVFSGNPIGRIRAVLDFFLAVLVGFGFDALQRRHEQRAPSSERTSSERASSVGRARGWRLLVVAASLALIADVSWYAYRQSRSLGFRHELVHRLVGPGIFVVAALICVGLVYLHRTSTTAIALTVLPVLVIIQGAAFFHTVLPGDTRANFYPVTPTHQFLKDNLGADRFAGDNGVLYPATSLYYGLRSATGHTFHEYQWAELIGAVDTAAMPTATFSDFTTALTPTAAGSSKILDRMSVKYFVTDPSDLVGDFEPMPAFAGAATVTAASPAAPATCQLPAGALRGVSVDLASTLLAADANKGLTLNVTVRAAGTTISSGRFLGTGIPGDMTISIPVAGEDLPAGAPISVGISASGAAAPLVLHAQAGGHAACAAVRPTGDGLKVAFADAGSIVYQRLNALPRIRWASASTVVSNDVANVVALERGLPDDEVLLDAPGPAADGKSATVSVLTDSPNRISADVDAAGAGYLVIADALQQAGWSATVDGKPASLHDADHAMVAIAVPAGTHRVTLSYRAPGQLAGTAVSGLAVLVMIGVGVGPRRLRRVLG